MGPYLEQDRSQNLQATRRGIHRDMDWRRAKGKIQRGGRAYLTTDQARGGVKGDVPVASAKNQIATPKILRWTRRHRKFLKAREGLDGELGMQMGNPSFGVPAYRYLSGTPKPLQDQR